MNCFAVIWMLIIGAGTNLGDSAKLENVEGYENGISSIKYIPYYPSQEKQLVNYGILDCASKYNYWLTVCKTGKLIFSHEKIGSSGELLIGNIDQKYLNKLIEVLNKNNISSIKGKNQYYDYNVWMYSDTGKDIIKYRITFYDSSKEKTIWVSSKDSLSQECLNILSELNKLVDVFEKKEQEFRKNMLIKYVAKAQGCFGGKYELLTIYKDGTVYYLGDNSNCDLKSEFNKEKIEKIIEVFKENNFFSLKDSYLVPNYSTGTLEHTIFYNYNSKIKTVFIQGPIEPSELPKHALNIIYELNKIIEELAPETKHLYPSEERIVRNKKKNTQIQTKTSGTVQIEISGELADRTRIGGSTPPYPDWAQKQGLNAVFSVSLKVYAEGKITGPTIVISPTGYPEWDNGVIKWLEDNWRWEKIPSGETPGTITIRFTIQ